MRRLPSDLVRPILWVQNAVLALIALPFARREVARVLLYRTARIGDFVVAIPAMVALRNRYPNAEIVLLTTTSTTASPDSVRRSLQKAHTPPWFSFVTPSVIDRICHLPGDDRKAMVEEAREAIRKFRPDVAILLSSNLETFAQRLRKILFFRLAGLRAPILGWRMRQSLDFDPHAQATDGMLEHNVVSVAKSVYELPGMPAFDPRNLSFSLARPPEVIFRINDIWRELGLEGHRVVALFPGATFAHKRWPVEKYAALARAVAEEPETRIVVLGAESDREVTDELFDQIGDISLDLTGRLSLAELTEFLSRASLYVGNDTGPMHISAAVGTPTVGVMNHQELSPSWEPWGGVGLKHDVPCKGCYSYESCPLGTRACIVDLPVERVVATVMPILRNVGEER